MYKLYVFLILSFRTYILINGKTLSKQRKEDANTNIEQKWIGQIQTTKGLQLKHIPVTNSSQNEITDYPDILEEDASMNNSRQNQMEDGTAIYQKGDFKMAFELSINGKTGNSRFLSSHPPGNTGNSRSPLSSHSLGNTLARTETDPENSSSLARSLTGEIRDWRDTGLFDDLAIKKRFGGYKRNIVLQNIKHWLSRRYGYFDSLASSILRK